LVLFTHFSSGHIAENSYWLLMIIHLNLMKVHVKDQSCSQFVLNPHQLSVVRPRFQGQLKHVGI